ncbi:hypothetical protein Bca4012_020744 [Brassica carinata]
MQKTSDGYEVYILEPLHSDLKFISLNLTFILSNDLKFDFFSLMYMHGATLKSIGKVHKCSNCWE